MFQRLRAWLDTVFEYEAINGNEQCPTYLHRWTLLDFSGPYLGRRLYLHHFVGNDWARDPHDHPKWFVSIGLWGSYIEHAFDRSYIGELVARAPRRYRAPWVRWFPPEHIHRIEARNAWTLVWTGKARREWGFYLPTRAGNRGPLAIWCGWDTYIRQHGLTRKAC